MREIELPTETIKPNDPRLAKLLLFGESGVGKSPIAAQLPNSLVLSFDPSGMKFVEACYVQIKEFDDLRVIQEAIRKHRKDERAKAAVDPTYIGKDKYKFIVVDTITYLVDLCVTEAENMYSRSPMGKHWFVGKDAEPSGKAQYGSILSLADGAGYAWLRQAVESALDIIETMAANVVILAHTRTNRESDQVDSKNIDLPGKLVDIVCRRMEAVGHLARIADDRVTATFQVGKKLSSKSKIDRLEGNVFVISQKKDGKIVTYWDEIFDILKPEVKA